MRLLRVPKIDELKTKRDVDGLIKALRHRDGSVRTRAARALGDQDLLDTRAVEPLIAALKDNHKGVREQAAWSLNYLRDPRATEPAIAALRDEDADVRQGAVNYLVGEIYRLRDRGDERGAKRLMEILDSAPAAKAGEVEVEETVWEVLRGSLEEPYCSQECYDRGGATITTTLLQGWSGDCSVCRRPLQLAVGSPGSIVCYKPGLLLYFHQEPTCVDAVRAQVVASTACVVCGTEVDTAGATDAYAAATKLADVRVRMFIKESLTQPYQQSVQQVAMSDRLTAQAIRETLVKRPRDAILDLIERASGLPDGGTRNRARSAALSAAGKWERENVPSVPSEKSHEMYFSTDAELRPFDDWLKSIGASFGGASALASDAVIKALVDVCVEAFVEDLRKT